MLGVIILVAVFTLTPNTPTIVLPPPMVICSLQQVALLTFQLQYLAARVIISVALPARAEKEIATAGTGNPTLTTGDAPDSICPYAWRLPGYSGSGSYYDLIGKYTNRIGKQDFTNADTSILTPLLGSLRSGGYNYTNGSLYDRSSNGRYWLSSGYSTVNAYYLSFASSYIYPQNNANHGYGFALRCLAR